MEGVSGSYHRGNSKGLKRGGVFSGVEKGQER